jgi:hypothetical protein
MTPIGRQRAGIFGIWALFCLVLCTFVLPISSCKGNGNGGSVREDTIPRTGKVKVKPHDDINRQGTYCKYKVIAPLPKGAVLKADDVICVLCGANKNSCDDFSEVEEEDGTVYKVQALTKKLACEACPKGTDSTPGYPRRER